MHDPAQAWNALTVGAFTEKSVITHRDWDGWSALSPPGELSPYSTTSVAFQEIWPTKPEVVFEGGNVAYDGTNFDPGVPDLCLLSTHYKPTEKLFVLSHATSAATAQVARIAANSGRLSRLLAGDNSSAHRPLSQVDAGDGNPVNGCPGEACEGKARTPLWVWRTPIGKSTPQRKNERRRQLTVRRHEDLRSGVLFLLSNMRA